MKNAYGQLAPRTNEKNLLEKEGKSSNSKDLVKNFLGNTRVKIYIEMVQTLLER